MAGRVCVARVGAAHGVRGEVRLWSFTETPEAIAGYGPLETGDGKRRFEIVSLRAVKDHFVARLKGVDDRNAAEALRNVELYVARNQLPAIEEDDTFYVADLVGLAAVTAEGEPLGTVTAVHNFGAGDIIEIAPAAGAPLMLSFTAANVPAVDVKAGRIVVALPEEVEGEDANAAGNK